MTNDFDPFGSMQGLTNKMQQFQQNPMGFIAQQGLNIPQQYASDPSAALQYLMNNGQLNQVQYNWASQMVQRFQNNPMIKNTMRF